jgi:hypothetical protein
MGIVGGRPESGVRIALERPVSGAAPWRYEGTVATPDAEHPVACVVDDSGDVRVELAATAPPELSEKVRLLVRTAYKQAKADGKKAPARKIVRWRGEK